MDDYSKPQCLEIPNMPFYGSQVMSLVFVWISASKLRFTTGIGSHDRSGGKKSHLLIPLGSSSSSFR